MSTNEVVAPIAPKRGWSRPAAWQRRASFPPAGPEASRAALPPPRQDRGGHSAFAASTHFRNGQAAGGHNQRWRGERSGIGQKNKLARRTAAAAGPILAPHLPNVCPETDSDIRGGTLARQHGGNLFGGAVAKELSQRLFVVGETRLLDQCDEIRRSIARQRRSGKMRIGR